MKPIDLTGQRFGRAIALKQTGHSKTSGGYLWECSCDCGKIFVTASASLQSGGTKSCGCLRSELSRKMCLANRTHGLSRTPGYGRDQKRFKMYGVSPEEVARIIKLQSGKCPGCLRERELATLKRTAIDHCHTTDRVRGILCNKCNCGMGLLNDNPAILQRLTRYLLAP